MIAGLPIIILMFSLISFAVFSIWHKMEEADKPKTYTFPVFSWHEVHKGNYKIILEYQITRLATVDEIIDNRKFFENIEQKYCGIEEYHVTILKQKSTFLFEYFVKVISTDETLLGNYKLPVPLISSISLYKVDAHREANIRNHGQLLSLLEKHLEVVPKPLIHE